MAQYGINSTIMFLLLYGPIKKQLFHKSDYILYVKTHPLTGVEKENYFVK